MPIIENLPVAPGMIKDKIIELQSRLAHVPGRLIGGSPEYLAVNPLAHTFLPGIYIRDIILAKDYYFITAEHLVEHPYFIMYGDVSILTDEGFKRVKGPYHGITSPGTKRLIRTHEETRWITVHPNPDNCTDPDKFVEAVTAHEDVDFTLFELCEVTP
jgi:hypothetical protein